MVHTPASAASAWFIYFGCKPLWLSGDIFSSGLFLLKHRDTVMLKDANNMHKSYIRRATTASIINYQLPRRSVCGPSKQRTNRTDHTGPYVGTTTPHQPFFPAAPAVCVNPTRRTDLITWWHLSDPCCARRLNVTVCDGLIDRSDCATHWQ